MSKILGIDLGTSNSRIAVVEDGRPRVIPNREGARKTPSVVALTSDGERIAGRDAVRLGATEPGRTVFGFLRIIGRRFDSSEIRELTRTSPYPIIEAENGDAHIQVGNQVYSPPEICASLLSELKGAAENDLGDSVEEAVITVPTFFNDSQRQAVKDAATIAGLTVHRILNASSAAGLAYRLTREGNGRFAFYDLGGGTFDVALLEFHEGVCRVLASGGDTFLGGEDIDRLIIHHLMEKSWEEHEIDLRGDQGAYPRLKEAAEQAKCVLSTENEASISFPLGPGESKRLDTVLTRGELEMMTAPILDRTVAPCRRIFTDTGLIVNDISDVLVVGGQTRAPAVLQVAARAFGKQPLQGPHPDEIVSMGAAVQAGILEGEIDDLLLIDIAAHTLGLETQGGAFTPLIERNSVIPTKKSRTFTTVFDNQKWVDIHVLQGQAKEATLNRSLGRYQLADITPGLKGVPQIEVSFEIDIDGIAKVSAIDRATGRDQKVTVRASSGLSEEEIHRLKKALDRRGAEERKEKAVALRGEIQMLMASVRPVLDSVAPVLSADDHQAVLRALDGAQKARIGEEDDLELTLERLLEAADIVSAARQKSPT